MLTPKILTARSVGNETVYFRVDFITGMANPSVLVQNPSAKPTICVQGMMPFQVSNETFHEVLKEWEDYFKLEKEDEKEPN